MLTQEIRQALAKQKSALLAALVNRHETAPIQRRSGDYKLAPLSYAQQRLWFLDQLSPMETSYNDPAALRIIGDLDISSFGRSLNKIIERHEVLRTRFILCDGEARQEIADSFTLDIPMVDLSGLGPIAREAQAHGLLSDMACRPFDLSTGPLLRALLLDLVTNETGDREHLACFVMHHIVSDGWSMDILIREFTACYTEFSSGRVCSLPPLPIQYADYALWQREWLTGDVLDRQLSYWRRVLDGVPAALDLPTDWPRPAMPDGRGATHRLLISRQTTEKLNVLSRRAGATLFMTLLASFFVLLSRYSGQKTVCVGTPIANRRRVELEGLIGFFVNTLTLRGDLNGDPRFFEFLARVREVSLGAQAHQDLPFERLVEELRPVRDMSRSPLFQAMFVMQNAPSRALTLPGLRFENIALENETAKFDLTLSIAEEEDGVLSVSFEYGTSLFLASTIKRIATHYVELVEAVATDPVQRLSELSPLTRDERSLLGEVWNSTTVTNSNDGLVHELFERQAELFPDREALVFNEERLSYDLLNKRANKLAHELIDRGVGPDIIVGLCVESSPDVVVGLLGILKAGGAYLPLDPSYPPERLSYVIGDSAPLLILTQERLRERLPAGTQLICLDTEHPAYSKRPSYNPLRRAQSQNLAYVIYTSGSTGRPKGVLMPHSGLLQLLSWHEEVYPGLKRTLQFASLSFDVSFQEMFVVLGSGGALVLVSEDDKRDFPRLLRLLDFEHVERVFVPFAVLQPLAELVIRGHAPPRAVREIISAGEQLLLTPSLTAWLKTATPCRLINQYGPTETHVVKSHVVTSDDGALPPIGRPIWNTRIYILDGLGGPVPIGVAGELYIGGVGLARGYLNRADLTAERFVPDPFSTTGERLYRTGDLCRYRPDGEIEYLGRIDTQVKIRGFRIELGEIEAQLSRLPEVREAVVVARQDEGTGEKRLVAYVTGREGARPEIAGVRAALSQWLPDYMVPAAFVVLDALPLNRNGKIDRRALPAPDMAAARSNDYVAPRSETEALLCEIWGDVLGVDRVSVEDNFFELGGHSLLAVRVMARVGRDFGCEPALRTLFAAPTVCEFAKAVEAAQKGDGEGDAAPPLVSYCRSGMSPPLSYAQQRLWFLDQLTPSDASYNVPAALRLVGEIDIGSFERAVNEIVSRHEVLRTRFVLDGGEARQEILASLWIEISRVDLRGVEGREAREAEARRLATTAAQLPFDLARGPLLRVGLFDLGKNGHGEEEHVAVFVLHHIVSDGWSTDVLIREFGACYAAFRSGEPCALSPLAIQYADYALWQREWLTGEVLERQLSYWRRALEGAPAALDLPTDWPRPATPDGRGATLEIVVDAQIASGLRSLSRREGATLFMTLLAAFQLLLSRYSGQVDICVGAPVANRRRVELEGLIGFFVNTLVLRGDLSGDPSFVAFLSRVRETALSAQMHQDLPFERLVEELHPERDMSRAPLFQAMFVLQNAPSRELDLSGLRLEPVEIESGTSKFDLTLSVAETADGSLICAFEYATSLFEASTIARLAGHYETLLEGIVAKPQARLSDLPLLDDLERRLVLEAWNATTASYASSLFFMSFFRRGRRRVRRR